MKPVWRHRGRAPDRRSTVRVQATALQGRYRDLVDSLQAIFWEEDPATRRITFVSPQAEALLGYPVEQWLTEGFWANLLHPEDRQQVLAHCLRAIRQGGDHYIEYRAVRADGRVVWFRDLVHVVLDAEGQPVTARGLMIDITERRRAEEALRFLAEASKRLASSLEYETTLQSVAHLTVPHLADWCTVNLLDDSGQIRRVGVAHADPGRVHLLHEMRNRFPPDQDCLYGLPNVLRTGQFEHIPEVTDSLLAEYAAEPEHRALLRALGFASYVCVPLLARGRTLGALTLASAEPSRYRRTELELVEELARRCALAIDNARLYREAEQARAEAQTERTRLQAILENAPHAIIFVEAGTGLQMTNPRADELLGPPASSSTGPVRGSGRVRRSEDRPLTVQELPSSRALEGQSVSDEELLIVRADGQRIPVLASAAPVRGPAGEVTGAVIALQDVSALKELERLRDDFLSMLVHELRSPITAIKAISSGLRREGVVWEALTQREFLRAIEEEADRLAHLATDLLDVARLEAGAFPMELEGCHLADIIEGRRRQLEALSLEHLLQVEVPLDLPEVLADYEQVGRVLVNLVSNATKYSSRGSEILVQASAGPDVVTVHVVDHGVGLTQEERKLVFDKFYRVRRSGSPTVGAGLGLALCRGIVEAHGGRIWVESTAGQGSSFCFSLPVAPAAEPRRET